MMRKFWIITLLLIISVNLVSATDELAFPSPECFVFNETTQNYTLLLENSQPSGCDGDNYCDIKGVCRKMEWKFVGTFPACRPSNDTFLPCNPSNIGIEGDDIQFKETLSTSDSLRAYDNSPSPWKQTNCNMYICNSVFEGPTSNSLDLTKMNTACTVYNKTLKIYTAIPENSQPSGCKGNYYCDSIGMCRKMKWEYKSTGIACRPSSNNSVQCNAANINKEAYSLIGSYPSVGWIDDYNSIISSRTSNPSVAFDSLLYYYDDSFPIGQRPCDSYICKLDGDEIMGFVCGDGVCDNNETCSLCSIDCGTCLPENNGGNSGGGGGGSSGGSGGGSPSTSGGSSSGGGSSTTSGTTTQTNEFTTTSEQLLEGYTQELNLNDKINFGISSNDQTEIHSLTINNIGTDFAELTIQSEPIKLRLNISEEKTLELDNDNYYDLYIKLESIENSKAKITIKQIHELVESENSGITGSVIGFAKSKRGIAILIFGLVIVIVGFIIMTKKEKLVDNLPQVHKIIQKE